MLGIALGCIGLRYDDFCRMTFKEFAAVWNAYAEQRDTDFKDKWERMRLLATIVIQPHISKKYKITPEKLLRFPWECKGQRKKEAPTLTRADQCKRMEELASKLGDELI